MSDSFWERMGPVSSPVLDALALAFREAEPAKQNHVLADSLDLLAMLSDSPAVEEMLDYLSKALASERERKSFPRVAHTAREQVERELHEAGIIEDPDVDGGLLG